MSLTERWIEWADGWWPVLGSWSLQAGLVAGILIVIAMRGRRLPSRVSYALLCLALIKFAIPPVFGLPTGLFTHASRWLASPPPAASVSVAATARSETPASADASQLTLKSPAQMEVGLPSDTAEPAEALALPPVSAIDPMADFAGNEGERARVDLPLPDPSVPWTAWLVALQLLGSLAISAWALRSGWRLKGLLRRARAAGDSRTGEAFAASLRRVRPWRAPRLLVSSEIDGPMAFGVMRPVVLIPTAMPERLSGEELETVFDHELTHHRHGDLWISGCQFLLSIAWWFHPMIWILNRKLRQTREDWCDDSVLGRHSAPQYCQTLLRVAASSSAPRLPHPASIAMSSGRDSLERRFRRLLTSGATLPRVSTATGFALVIALAALLLPGFSTGTPESGPVISAQDGRDEGDAGRSAQEPTDDRTLVRGFRLENTDPQSVLTTLKELVTGTGSAVKMTVHGSTLFVRGTRQQVEDIEGILSQLDIAAEQGVAATQPNASTFFSTRTTRQAAEAVLRDLELDAEVRNNGIDGFFEVVGSPESRAAALEILKTLPATGPAKVEPGAFESTYTVKQGDTLAKIAMELFGAATYWKRIAEYNGIDPSKLQVGQRLRIPAPSQDPVLVGLELEGTVLRMAPHDPLMTAASEAREVRLLLSQPLLSDGASLKLSANEIQVEASQVRASLWLGLDRSPVRLLLKVHSKRDEPVSLELSAVASKEFPNLRISAERLVLTPIGGGPPILIEGGQLLVQSQKDRAPVASVLAIIAEADLLDGALSQGVVQLSLGAHQSVSVGDVFTVYRGDRYIARTEVIEVEEFQSKARVTGIADGQRIQVYDSASKDL